LTDHLTGSGRHITADNFFTNITLVRSLLGRQLTYTGTIRKNKEEIPVQMLPNRQRPVSSSVIGFQRKRNMASYVPKSTSAVILLFTFHVNAEVTDGKDRKRHIVLDYNKYNVSDGIHRKEKREVGRFACFAIFWILWHTTLLCFSCQFTPTTKIDHRTKDVPF
jgi:hypothetical protein